MSSCPSWVFGSCFLSEFLERQLPGHVVLSEAGSPDHDGHLGRLVLFLLDHLVEEDAFERAQLELVVHVAYELQVVRVFDLQAKETSELAPTWVQVVSVRRLT